ncbi:hypothetical protein FQN55_007653 [Onygenales sp. PD_40]|nr:hypothetical protein FQN55_007653 [Onygenales sp. PD_40]
MEIASSNFPQQGQVDWVALSSSSLTFTRDLLARLAKANIDANTVATGRVLFSAFSVGPRVQNEILETLKTLKSFQSYGNLIWLGFGVKSLVRDLADSEPGLACIALCSCLSISYGSFFAGEVLRDFAKHRGAPAEFIPSIHQWSTLVDLCAGSLAGSKFPSSLEGFIRLAIPRTDPFPLKPTSSEALSRALNVVADISRGKLARATFVGGIDCLWLAALSEWLLFLKVEVINAEETIHLSSIAHTCPHSQVVIILDSTDEWKAGPLLDRKWHIIPTGSKLLDIPKLGTPTFSGAHSDWTTILRDSFGSSFSKLIDESTMDHVGFFLIASCCKGLDGRFCLHKILRLDTNWSVSPRHPQWSTLCEFVSSRLPELAGIMDRCRNLKGEARDLDLPTGFCPFLEVETSLLPYPAGLRILYMRYLAYWRTKMFDNGGNILRIPLEIFTGRTLDTTDTEMQDASALCNDGICVFYRALEDLDLSPEEAFKIRVVQGHIEFEGSARARVGAVEERDSKNFDTDIPGPRPQVSYSLIVEETPHPKVINAAYRVLGRSQPGKSLVNIPILANDYSHQRDSALRCSHARTSADSLEADIDHLIRGNSTDSFAKTMSLNLGWSIIIYGDRSMNPITVSVVRASFPRMYLQFTTFGLVDQLRRVGFPASDMVEIVDLHSCLPCLASWCERSKRVTGEIKLYIPSQSNQWKILCAKSPQFDLIPPAPQAITSGP